MLLWLCDAIWRYIIYWYLYIAGILLAVAGEHVKLNCRLYSTILIHKSVWIVHLSNSYIREDGLSNNHLKVLLIFDFRSLCQQVNLTHRMIWWFPATIECWFWPDIVAYYKQDKGMFSTQEISISHHINQTLWQILTIQADCILLLGKNCCSGVGVLLRSRVVLYYWGTIIIYHTKVEFLFIYTVVLVRLNAYLNKMCGIFCRPKQFCDENNLMVST